MERLLEDWQHEYRATPSGYPISNNESPATYDQFITLRDTLVFSNKYYADKAGRSLIIGTKLDWTPTDTIEIREPNIFIVKFEPWWQRRFDGDGNYIETWWHESVNPISCEIMKKWRYVIQHKAQFNNISSNITRIHCYVIQHHASWGSDTPRAVYDWEWNTPWEIIRMTAFGYVECDLDKWDWLEYKAEDQWWNSIIPDMATDSNWWMVEYKDLAYNI
jgi:hypothetical protein